MPLVRAKSYRLPRPAIKPRGPTLETPCELRIHTDSQYNESGAVIAAWVETMSPLLVATETWKETAGR